MSSNVIFSRLEALIKKLGLSAEPKTFTRAELKAYAAGISLAEQKMNDAIKNVFIDTADNTGIALFLSMVNEKPADTAEKSKKAVISAVSENAGIYTKSYFDNIVKTTLTSGQPSYTVGGNSMIFNYNGSGNRPQFEEFSKLISDYNPCTVYVDNRGGRTFAKWDSAGFRWFELDGFSIPFITLDKMK